jgi:predicted NBD/HSP70 family sugar kinase
LIQPNPETVSSGGRPATSFAFNPALGVILAADLGASHSRLAVTDLAGAILAERSADLPIAAGPEPVLDWVEASFAELLAEDGRDTNHVWGVGVGLPGPVDFERGITVNPPIMPGWDGYPVADRLTEQFGAPVLVDNDVNIMATGEHSIHWREVSHLLFVKVGTGIGSGIIASGAIHRGEDGAAGDIGHIHISGHDDIICPCGNTGCLEAVAGGGAIARRLSELGLDAPDARAAVELALAGNIEAVQLIRRSGRLLGEALASAVNLLNPRLIVIGGDLARAEQQLFAGLREVIYQRSLPLATRHLRIVSSQLEARAGVIGCATMVINHTLTRSALPTQPSTNRPPAA